MINKLLSLLNIGCGSAFHPDWTNVDLVSLFPHVQAHDIRRGLPYPNASFDACYSSHLIEHLTPSDASRLLAECYRVLKSDAIIRIVVPDLETIVRNYILTLEQVMAGDTTAEASYNWMMLELYDQTVRQFPGGEMARYLTNPNISNKDFVLSRLGVEAEHYWSQKRLSGQSFWNRFKSKKPSWFVKKLRITLAKASVRLIAGRESVQAFEEGLFRNQGEIHRWMYDRFSLRRLLEQSGFVDIQVCQADESRIPNFNSYSLDIINDQIRKPDSLFIEGVKS